MPFHADKPRHHKRPVVQQAPSPIEPAYRPHGYRSPLRLPDGRRYAPACGRHQNPRSVSNHAQGLRPISAAHETRHHRDILPHAERAADLHAGGAHPSTLPLHHFPRECGNSDGKTRRPPMVRSRHRPMLQLQETASPLQAISRSTLLPLVFDSHLPRPARQRQDLDCQIRLQQLRSALFRPFDQQHCPIVIKQAEFV